MKPARERESSILEEDGVVFGVVLAGDFTAEHEWGIGPIRRLLGLSDKPFGFAERCITDAYTGFGFKKGRFKDKLFQDDSSFSAKSMVEVKCATATLSLYECHVEHTRFRRYMAESKFVGAWSDGGFIITGFDKEGIALVELLRDGLSTGDFAVWQGGSNMNPFTRAGLVLVRPSLVPQKYKDQMDQIDQDAKNLAEASERTGIVKRIIEAGRGFFACSPISNKRSDGTRMRDDTTYDVVYWLNPTEQGQNNHGWFTVEELDHWLKGEGPVPK